MPPRHRRTPTNTNTHSIVLFVGTTQHSATWSVQVWRRVREAREARRRVNDLGGQQHVFKSAIMDPYRDTDPRRRATAARALLTLLRRVLVRSCVAKAQNFDFSVYTSGPARSFANLG